MRRRRTKIAIGIAALAALALLGGAAIAGAGGAFDDETPLQGRELARASTTATSSARRGRKRRP